MMTRVQELCRKLKPVLGTKVDKLYRAYLADADASGKAGIEQTLELLAARHLGQDYQQDRTPFPPPSQSFAASGDIELGSVSYAGRDMYPFRLKKNRLKEHILIAGRSGSGKTNLTFMLMLNAMDAGIKVLALDWKRGYRDLLEAREDLRVYTIGRDVSPFRFNPLIPPPGCEPQVWIKLIVDVIANAYLGGEGVISLLVAGLDKLYYDAGVYDQTARKWPTIQDLLVWLKTVKLKGRAAMWQASAERILLAMTYGEFAAVVNTQDNNHVRELLDQNVILEMDGLSSNSDRTMFSEALTLYLYRYRLGQGPQRDLTNLIILEEAHNLLLKKANEAKESVLETSIRMIRQYGMGYVFVDQSASLLSKVAFANSYATLALSQKLRADIQTISGAMNLTDDQRDALSTLPIGSAVVRLADEHTEPFLVTIPRCPIREGSVSDAAVRARMAGSYGDSAGYNDVQPQSPAVPPVPYPDNNSEHNRNNRITEDTHPPTPTSTTVPTQREAMGNHPIGTQSDSIQPSMATAVPDPPARDIMTRDAIRFIADVAARPLSTTVSRYQRLHLSRRRGNAIKDDLLKATLIESVTIATRSGQVILYELTEYSRQSCSQIGIDPGPLPRESLEHRFWVQQARSHYEQKGYDVVAEHVIAGNGAVDLLAERPGERVAIEVETGKSDVAENVRKALAANFDRVILIATSPEAVAICQKVIDDAASSAVPVEFMTWLDVG